MFLKKKLVFVLVPLLLALSVPAASLADTGTQTAAQPQGITLGQAIKMADSSNATLQQDQIQAKMANNSSASAAGFSGVVSSAWALQFAELTLASEQDSVVYGTEQDYFTVQDAVYGEQVAQKALQVAQEGYQLAQDQANQGVQTKAFVTQAKAGLEQAQSGLTQAKTAVNTAYVNFDNTVGLDPSARPDLTSVATYDPNYETGLSGAQDAVSAALKNNPSIMMAQDQYNMAVQTQAAQTPGDNGPLYLQNAQLTYNLAVQNLTYGATAAYLAVGYDQAAYSAAVKAAEYAQTTCDDDQVSYQAGVITRYQLDSDEEALMAADQSAQMDLHTLLEARAELAVTTGVGSIQVPVTDK